MERNRQYSPQMTETARRLRKEQTPAETRLWEIVRGRRCGGLRFLRQIPAGQYVLDFYCASVRLAIEVDGGIHELPEVRQRDRDRQTALEDDLHLNVLRLTNAEVLEGDTPSLQARIADAAHKAAQRVLPWGERPARRR